jgi:hypothetical protein
MFHPTLSKRGRFFWAPIIKACEFMGNHFPVTLLKWRYRYVFKKSLDLKNPKDLNEKILWAKLFSDTSRWTELADKYRVRKYVEALGLGKYLVKLYAVWYDVKEVNFDVLPDSFIIKANNGDGKGTNKIIRKSELTTTKKQELMKLIDEWLHRKNIGALHAEPQYKVMRPCVIAEEVLPLEPGATSLIDYKIWCFNGLPCFIYVCGNRSEDGTRVSVMAYDLDWNAHPEWCVFTMDQTEGIDIPKPENLNEMLIVAKKLSAGFPEIRVDLYNINGNVFLGELTFTSQGGMMDYFTPEFNLELGSKFDIKDFPIKK